MTNRFPTEEFSESELIIGLVGAIGTELSKVTEILSERLSIAGYEVFEVRISSHVIPRVASVAEYHDEYGRISNLMDAGNEARKTSGDNGILALGAASLINTQRKEDKEEAPKRRAFIISSLKHPEEVQVLRKIYPEGFYLLCVFSDKERRHDYLRDNKRIIDEDKIAKLMDRDEDEHLDYGQLLRKTFYTADFFVRIDGFGDRLKNDLWRIIDILFGNPYQTPTFHEYAMFLAFAASLRSGDLSRQVGAVIARDREILGTGANDCPRFGGGLYWPEYNEKEKKIRDFDNGRDYMRGYDSNQTEQVKIIDAIIKTGMAKGIEEELLRDILNKSKIADLTEYGRVVHAEMEAILACGRNGVSCGLASLYTTTFPCHNCTKHIVASGIVRVVFIEPYPKSKALELHDDSISLEFHENHGAQRQEKVCFEPFVGVGPRRFYDLFSIPPGTENYRKNEEGKVHDWQLEGARLKMQMKPSSYIELEQVAIGLFDEFIETQGGSE